MAGAQNCALNRTLASHRLLRLKVEKTVQAGALVMRCKGLVRLDARSVLLFCSRRLERGQEQTALTEAPLRFRKESDFKSAI